MKRRVVVLAIFALAVVAAWLVFNPVGQVQSLIDGTGEEATGPAPRGQSEVSVRDLVRTVESTGTLELSSERTISASSTGVVTNIAPLGTRVERSVALFEVDDYPTVTLVGDIPAWREMTVDSVGPDVEQLERNLVAMGYDTTGELTVDETYTDFTAELVEQWQTDLGVDATGRLAMGSVVFVPEDSSIVDVLVSIGDSLTGGETALVSTASETRTVEVVVPTSELDSLAVGAEVTATLPDRSTITGNVRSLSPTGDGTWMASVPVVDTEAESDESELPEGESVPVTVTWTEQLALGVKTVPANALSRLDNGSYVVEVVVDGGTEFVEVSLGAQVGSAVEIEADLQSGTVVVTP